MNPKTLHREYPELKGFRDRIDAIDNRLVSLLIERSQVVRQVGELKRSRGEETNFIRPDREALMIRRTAQAFAEEAFSPRAAAALWRIIIGASTSMEAPLRLVVAGNNGLIPARDHFGPSLPCRVYETDVAMEEMRHDSHAIGIFPLNARTSDGLPWWRLENEKAIHVFARLPFMKFPAADAALGAEPSFATARIEPSPSGDDVTMFILGGEAQLPPGVSLVAEHGGERLVETDGWAPPGSEAYDSLSRLANGARFTYIGGYARPLTLSR